MQSFVPVVVGIGTNIIRKKRKVDVTEIQLLLSGTLNSLNTL